MNAESLDEYGNKDVTFVGFWGASLNIPKFTIAQIKQILRIRVNMSNNVR